MGSLTVCGAPGPERSSAGAGTHGSICAVPGFFGVGGLCHSIERKKKMLYYFPVSEEALASPGQEAHLCSAV